MRVDVVGGQIMHGAISNARQLQGRLILSDANLNCKYDEHIISGLFKSRDNVNDAYQ